MALKPRKTILTEAIEDWQQRGLLTPDTANILHTDIAPDHAGRGFSTFIITAGILCLCAAAISFVAANWDEMSRLTRVFLVFTTLWVTWGLSFWTASKGHRIWSEGFNLLACTLFGAGIMLVAQLYHLQGEAPEAVFLWFLGTLIAAALTRSGFALSLAIGLIALWHGVLLGDLDAEHINLAFVLWWALCALLAFALHNRLAAHFSLHAFVFWVISACALQGDTLYWWLSLACASLGLVALVLASAGTKRWFKGFESALLFYCLALTGGISFLLFFISDDWIGSEHLLTAPPLPAILALAFAAALTLWAKAKNALTFYDLSVTTLAIAIFTLVFTYPQIPVLREATLLAFFIWITRMGWRLSQRSLRALGIAGFTGAMLAIYAVTVGSLIGTSGFYLGAGVILLGGALIATRLKPEEKA